MATSWVRLWADMPNDPKWRTIARAAKQPISVVISIYVHMMVCAANATERGRTHGWSDEDIGSALDIETEAVFAVRQAMEGRVLEGDLLLGWEKRQPLREDGAAERAKAWREAKKEEEKRDRTQPNARKRPDTDTDTEKDTPLPPAGGDGELKVAKAIAFPEYLDRCKAADVLPIPETCSVFAYADKVGIPKEFLRLQWLEFKERYSETGAKKYKAWATVFCKSVRGNWFKLWYADKGGGGYALTTLGIQAEANHKGIK